MRLLRTARVCPPKPSSNSLARYIAGCIFPSAFIFSFPHSAPPSLRPSFDIHAAGEEEGGRIAYARTLARSLTRVLGDHSFMTSTPREEGVTENADSQ